MPVTVGQGHLDSLASEIVEPIQKACLAPTLRSRFFDRWKELRKLLGTTPIFSQIIEVASSDFLPPLRGPIGPIRFEMIEQELTKLTSSRRCCILAATGLGFFDINAMVAYQDEQVLLVQGTKEALGATRVYPREDRASIIAPQQYVTSLAERYERIVRQAIQQVSDH